MFFNNSQVDSVFDIGTVLSQDISSSNFRYTNGNCTYFTSTWTGFNFLPLPTAIQIYDTLTLYYTSIANTNMLRYQEPIDLNASNSFTLFLSFLQLDGYYILPLNNNLIDSFTNRNSTTKYFYEFDVNNNIVAVRMNTRQGTSTGNRFQYMTYY